MSDMKHNLIQDFSYEIYRPDGTLRERYDSDEKAQCEGTFEVECKNENGDVEFYEKHNIRSLQKWFLNTFIKKKFNNAGIE